MEGLLTIIPGPVIPSRMGRPPLSRKSETVMLRVRVTEDVRDRVEALAGPNQMAAFIREAIEAELQRRERASRKAPNP